MNCIIIKGRCTAGRKEAAGFTLIELLVVIAIIAILAAILFPVFSRVRQQGYHTSCLSNMRQLGMAMMQYVDDNRGRYPWNAGPRYSPSQVADVGLPRDDPSDASNRWDGAPIRRLLMPYVMDAEVFYCPALSPHLSQEMESGLVLPGEPDPKGAGTATDYQVNAYLVVNTIPSAFIQGQPVPRPQAGPVLHSQIPNPSKLRVFQDFWNLGEGVHFNGINAARADGSASWQRAEFGITNVAWWAD